MFPACNRQVLRTETTFLLSSFLLYSTLLFHASGFIDVNVESFFHCALENAGFAALTWFFGTIVGRVIGSRRACV